MNARSGNTKTLNLIAFINEEVATLKNNPINKRSMRQLVDADNFLKMLKAPPYCRTNTVSELKREISFKREELLTLIHQVEPALEGYQFTFEDILDKDNISCNMQKELENNIKNWQEELRWLHKCLGICVNMDYFK